MISRRAVLALAAVCCAPAQDRERYLEVLARLASALSTSDAYEFMRWVDQNATERGRLSALIEALVAQAEVTCSVDVVAVENSSARADWYMEVKARTPGTPVERRRREITVRINERGRIMELQPLEFFSPPVVQR